MYFNLEASILKLYNVFQLRGINFQTLQLFHLLQLTLVTNVHYNLSLYVLSTAFHADLDLKAK